ncbi:hypothetical protein MKW92_004211 [Papaver armeniacum]|nr:hypothetical protein MKW92_004211 [Papaver armeniacum]
MAKFSSTLVVNVVFLPLSCVLVSASTEQKTDAAILPSLEQVASPKDTNICVPNDVYNSEIWGPTQDCQCCCAKPPSPPPPTPTPTPSEECAYLGASVVNDKCAIGESKFVRRCKCCCRASSCPASGCPADVTWTIPGASPCKYKLISSLSSLPSSKLSI